LEIASFRGEKAYILIRNKGENEALRRGKITGIMVELKKCGSPWKNRGFPQKKY